MISRPEQLRRLIETGRTMLENLDYREQVKQVKMLVPFIMSFEEIDELRKMPMGYDWKVKFRLSLNQKKKTQSTVVILERIEKN